MSYAVPCYNERMSRLKRTGPTHRVSLELPEALYERLRLLAFTRRDSMNKIVVEYLEGALPSQEQPDRTADDKAPYTAERTE